MVDVRSDVKERLWKIPGYQEGMPAHRMDGVSTFDELELTWGRKWGAQSCIGELRFAWVHRHNDGPTEEQVADPVFFSRIARDPDDPPMDYERANRQLDELSAAVESEGVEVIRSDPPRDDQHGTYMSRIHGINLESHIVRGGALLANKATANHRGHERWSGEFLAKIGCPIIWQPIGTAIHETRGNMVFLDPKTLVQATNLNTNWEGIRQVAPILQQIGVEEIYVATLPGFLYHNRRTPALMAGHLCNVLTMADEKLGVVHSGSLPYETLMFLKGKGIRLIDTPPEEAMNQAANILAIRPGVVVMAAGNPITTASLRKEGVRVIEVDMSETAPYFAGPLCKVGALVRDDGPYLDD